MTTCDWCGHAHEIHALCAQRPTWSRRGFLALMGSALAGAMIPIPALPEPQAMLGLYQGSGLYRWVAVPNVDLLIAGQSSGSDSLYLDVMYYEIS